MANDESAQDALTGAPDIPAMPQDNRASTGVIISCAVFILLHLGASMFFTNLSWGINFFHFLPPYAIIVYAVLGAAALLYGFRKTISAVPETLLRYWNRHPLLFVSGAILAFLALALLLRVRLPLLGDSFVIINNYENTLAGGHGLYAFREPVAIYFFFWIIRLVGVTTYPAMLWGFMFGQMVLGIIYILAGYALVKLVTSNPKHQLMIFFLLLTIPSMQVFFGYAEIYAAVVVTTMLYVLAAVNYLQKGTLFFLIYPAFLLLVCTHFLGSILFPSLIYLTYLEYRRHGIRNLAIGLVIVAAAAGMLAYAVDGQFSRFIPADQHSPLLSLFSPGDMYQAYPMFSMFHFTELANLLLLGCPACFLFIGLLIAGNRKSSSLSSVDIFLAICSGLFLAFLLVAKFDLGMAKDWDVVASAFVVLNLTIAVFALRAPDSVRDKGFALAALTGIISIVPWFCLNATEEANIHRTFSLLDDRILSREGFFQTSFHLSRAYLAEGDTASMMPLWEQYVSKYPGDAKGYDQLTKSHQYARTRDEKVLNVYDTWLRLEPANPAARAQYAQYCSDLGVSYVQRSNDADAERMFLKSISIDPGYAPAYNFLGYFHDQHGDRATAESLYIRAIDINPRYKVPYNNLGNIYRDAKQYDDAIRLYQTAIELDPKYVLAYENLAQTYFTMKNRDSTIATLQKAARLGSKPAQRILEQDGEHW
jgi:tetratricopeptide (TPR) repeat protein